MYAYLDVHNTAFLYGIWQFLMLVLISCALLNNAYYGPINGYYILAIHLVL